MWSCGENYHFLAKDWVKGSRMVAKGIFWVHFKGFEAPKFLP